MKKEDVCQLSEELKLRRFKEKKSQEDCASVLGISIPTYRDLEYNPNKMDLSQAYILGEYLHWNIFEFFLNNILQNAISNDSNQEKIGE